MATTLHLLIPGLLGPGHSGRVAPGFPLLVAPALEWLLARAVARPVPATTDETLFQLFGLSAPTAADLPVAALTRLADGGEREAEGWWLRADPVHLRPDLREILLVDSRVLAITAAEAEALATAFDAAASASCESGGAGLGLTAADHVDAEFGLAGEGVGQRHTPLLVRRQAVAAHADLRECGQLVGESDSGVAAIPAMRAKCGAAFAGSFRKRRAIQPA